MFNYFHYINIYVNYHEFIYFMLYINYYHTIDVKYLYYFVL
jgi:hypothetical protein